MPKKGRPSWPTVHEDLNDRFKAYSIYKPQPRSLNLFDIVLIRADPGHRHESPVATGKTLKSVLRGVSKGRTLSDAQKFELREIREELNKIHPAATDKPSPLLGERKQITRVQKGSILVAQGLIAAPGGGGGEAGLKRMRRQALKLELEDVRYREYSGTELIDMLWASRDTVLKKMVKSTRHILDVRGGQNRQLLAVVTKKITGSVSIVSLQYSATHCLAGVSAFFRALFGSDKVVEAEQRNLEGVVGIHMIVFPVEKTDGGWRVFMPVALVDKELTGRGKSTDRFSIVKQWALSEHKVLQYTNSHSKAPKFAFPDTKSAGLDIPAEAKRRKVALVRGDGRPPERTYFTV